jgi:hypothetical protein
MGIADSPLRNRAIFVQGAPRSGTTWLVTLLATHPEVAGVEAESHLFDFGVDRMFDNFEGRDHQIRGLNSYLEHREQLVDLVRELCDGVFLAMRSHVSRGVEPQFVVEKTPTSFPPATLDLSRKRECYPDAWYLHIVRDGDAVTRSLMRAPWVSDRSFANCNRIWRECVETTRDSLGDLPRYRELTYEELREAPTKVAGDLFMWLGIDADELVLENVRRLSEERFSELGAVPAAATERRRPLLGAVQHPRRVASKVRHALARASGGSLSRTPPQTTEDTQLAFNFVRAMRERDAVALASMTADSLNLAYRSAEGDLSSTGDEARAALLEIATRLFTRRHVGELWSSAGGGPREWWTRAPGQPFWTVFFSALSGDATRVDLAFGLTPKEGLINDVVIVSAGSLAGRPLRELGSSTEPPRVAGADSPDSDGDQASQVS